jgi:hypothetical protein
VTATPRVFVLSPASCGGERAHLLTSPRAAFPLARRLREPGGAPLAEVFSFLSGLYFRGKLAYARAFATPPPGAPGAGVLAITADAGLQPVEAPITLTALQAAATVDIHPGNPRYLRPLQATTRALAAAIGPRCEVVLLGSIASDKYVPVLDAVLGPRVRFPAEFAGRGDMSRGGLLLRCVAESRELTYVPLATGPRHGPRPPRLARPGRR